MITRKNDIAINPSMGARGGAFGWGIALRKVAGSISDGVIGIFHWHNPTYRTMFFGLTKPLIEMSTRNISWRGG